MQVSVEKTADLERRLTVELPIAGLMEKINERLETLKGQVCIEGYRPGKAPLEVVQNKYGAQIQQEILSEAVNDSLQQALAEEQLEPVGKPVVEIISFSPDSVLRYTATFEVMPQIVIQPVEQLKLVRHKVDITETDLDNMIETLRKQRLQWKPAGRPARSGDRVTIDYSGSISGMTIPGTVANGLPVIIGEGSLLPGLEDQLIGLRESETVLAEITIPETFPSPEHRNKLAHFEIMANKVEEPVLPELNETFFRSFGINEGNLAEFREQVRRNMANELKAKVLDITKQEILKQLLEINEIAAVPTSLIQYEINRMRQEKVIDENTGTTDEQITALAKYRAACGLILTELSKNLEISATPEQIREKIEDLAQTYENPDEVKNWYYSSKEHLASIRAIVTEEMLVNYILDHAQIKNQPMSFSEMMSG